MCFHTTPLCLPCYALPCWHCWWLASRLSSTQSITHALFPNLCWVIHWIKSILTLLTLYSWKMIIFFTFLVCWVSLVPEIPSVTCMCFLLHQQWNVMDELKIWKYIKVREYDLVLDSTLFKLKVWDFKHSIHVPGE